MTRFFHAVAAIDRVFKSFRTAFLGKSSPVASVLGQLRPCRDALFRSPRAAHPGGIPALPDAVAQEAYDPEVVAPASGPAAAASTIRPSIPTPIRRRQASPRPRSIRRRLSGQELGEFILPYETVRASAVPQATLLAFLESTYPLPPPLQAGTVTRSNANSACRAGQGPRGRRIEHIPRNNGRPLWATRRCTAAHFRAML